MNMAMDITNNHRYKEFEGLLFDFQTGNIYRKVNSEWILKRLTLGKDGYLKAHHMKKTWRANRLIYSAFIGRYLRCDELINHKNHNILDNSIDNLEIVTHSQNSQYRQYKTGKSTKGVFHNKKLDKYYSRISIDGIRTYIGWFHDKQEAHDAYLAKARELNAMVDEQGKPMYRYYIPRDHAITI